MQVRAASVALETLQIEMDQAQALLQESIDKAARIGTDPKAITAAMQLTSPEPGQPTHLGSTGPHH